MVAAGSSGSGRSQREDETQVMAGILVTVWHLQVCTESLEGWEETDAEATATLPRWESAASWSLALPELLHPLVSKPRQVEGLLQVR